MGKGGGFENEVCKDLSLWVTEGRCKDIFGRSDGSGSRFTNTAWKAISQAGDITFINEEGIPLIKEWCIECKTGYGKKKKVKDDEGLLIAQIQERWDLLDCIDSRKAVPFIIQAWSQCTRDAILVDRDPVLIFRRNLRGKCIAIAKQHFNRLIDFYGLEQQYSFLTLNTKEGSIVVMSLADFFEWIPNIESSFRKGDL